VIPATRKARKVSVFSGHVISAQAGGLLACGRRRGRASGAGEGEDGDAAISSRLSIVATIPMSRKSERRGEVRRRLRRLHYRFYTPPARPPAWREQHADAAAPAKSDGQTWLFVVEASMVPMGQR